MQDKLNKLELIVQTTANTEHRISYNGIEWAMYIVKSATKFTGTLEEVIQHAIDEFLSYRKPSKMAKTHKFYKKYKY